MRKDMIYLCLLLLIPIFFVAILALLHPFFNSEEFDDSKTKIQIENIEKALAVFEKDVGRYPDNLEGLNALIQDADNQHWKGPYIDKDQLIDAWGVPYKYKIIRKQHVQFLLIGSSGKNKQWETTDMQSYQELQGGDDVVIYRNLGLRGH